MKIHFLKTKWSDMILLEEKGEWALVDTGFAEQYEQLSEYLNKHGIHKISFILLTHFHRDHYGNIPALLENFQVEKVYLKEYSGLDSTTAWGTMADQAYRDAETKKYLDMREHIKKYSELIQIEGQETLREICGEERGLSVKWDNTMVSSRKIGFAGIDLYLFNAENSIREIYEDASNPEFYHQIKFSENQNSLGVFFEANGKRVFLGGDMMDHLSDVKKADRVVTQMAKAIGQQIDVYKVPHHGTVHTGTMEALNIFKPRLAIITNEDAYLSEASDVYKNLKEANPSVQIVLTENQDVVVDLETMI